MYLDGEVRRNTSNFALASADDLEKGLASLRDDVESGAWDRSYGHLLSLPTSISVTACWSPSSDESRFRMTGTDAATLRIDWSAVIGSFCHPCTRSKPEKKIMPSKISVDRVSQTHAFDFVTPS